MLYDLVGFTGSGLAHVAWKNFSENVPERAARLVHERKMGPAILVFPDCFTALGGNQYVNSSAIGDYADYLTRELVPFVDRELRTLASRDHRGCFGKSSGGYGAMLHGMRYARPGARSPITRATRTSSSSTARLAEHARRAREVSVAAGRARAASTCSKAERGADRGRDDGRVKRFLRAVWRKPKLSTSEAHCIMNLCMAATYDPDPRAPNGFRLPVNLETGEVLAERWARWRAHDPVNLVAKYRNNLRSLRGIYIDCGSRDQFHIHYGSRILSKRLREAGVVHVVRGVRRQPLRHRLPDGYLAAVPRTAR